MRVQVVHQPSMSLADLDTPPHSEGMTFACVHFHNLVGSFDHDDLLERITAATRAIVDSEPAITESVREVSLKCASKKQKVSQK